MNIPAWAEKELNKESAKDAALELQLMRHFFDAWELFHSISQGKDRKKSEAAATVLVEAAHAIRALRRNSNG